MNDLVSNVIPYVRYVIGVIIVLIIGFIKIPKLEINIWNWLGKIVGRLLFKELADQIKQIQIDVDDIDKKLSNHIYQDELTTIKSVRQKIIEFNDEILNNKRHSEEAYNCILEDIDAYEHYCDEHEDFVNNKAVFAISNIKDSYQQCLKNKEFK